MEYFTDLGYLGLFISCFLAATFIIPFSPELILGVLIAKGFNLQLTVIIATLGNWMGGMTSYYIGRIGDWKKIEKYFKIKKEKVFVFKLKIDKWGSVLAFFTWFPLGGDILALSLGFFKVDPYKISLWMLLGKFFRFVISAIVIYYGIDLIRFW
tara:strand:- start:622 stop:1083 length:462 start_codon:yes stop_codon:yes gene_type:complete